MVQNDNSLHGRFLMNSPRAIENLLWNSRSRSRRVTYIHRFVCVHFNSQYVVSIDLLRWIVDKWELFFDWNMNMALQNILETNTHYINKNLKLGVLRYRLMLHLILTFGVAEIKCINCKYVHNLYMELVLYGHNMCVNMYKTRSKK